MLLLIEKEQLYQQTDMFLELGTCEILMHNNDNSALLTWSLKLCFDGD